MLKTETKQIDGHSVTVTQFAGRRNLDILFDLSKTVGPTLAAAAGGMKGGDILDADINVQEVATTLFNTMEKPGAMALIMRLLESTALDDRPLDGNEFDRAFAGTDIWKLPKILMFVIEVNYGNFSALAANVSEVGGRAKPAKAPAN